MKKYDAIIIGSGIGGLICGCYLSKAGLRVLIIEQHNKVGGYCTSFKRSGYRFDVGIHYFGGVENGVLNRVLTDLDLKNKLQFKQFDPTDKIIMPDNTTYIRAKYQDTIKEFKKSFPNEGGNVANFFKDIKEKNVPYFYRNLKRYTFQRLLDEYFRNKKLKATLGSLLGNIGLPPERASALASVILFKEFILDPGYYPLGGIQAFPDALATLIKNNGGEILLSRNVTKILVKHNRVKGVVIDDDICMEAKKIVSNADLTHTFTNLLHGVNKEIEPSCSIFACYLGLKTNLKNISRDSCGIWNFASYDLKNIYSRLRENILSKNKPSHILYLFPSAHDPTIKDRHKSTMVMMFFVPFLNKKFWDVHKEEISFNMINNADASFPNIKKYIETKVIATPFTFYRYTKNTNGAAFGLASTLQQMKKLSIPFKTTIKGLYLAGHWCSVGRGQAGISGVSVAGKICAQQILREINN